MKKIIALLALPVFAFFLFMVAPADSLAVESEVTVSISKIDPPATALVRGEEVPVARITFIGSGEKIEVQRLTIHLTGTGNGNDIRRALLYNVRDQFVDSARIQDTSFSFSNLGPIVLRNGEMQTFTIKIEAGLAATLGETIGFQILDENSVHVESQKYDVKKVILGEQLKVSPIVILSQNEASLLSVSVSSDESSDMFFAPGAEAEFGTVSFSAFGESTTITQFTLTRAGELADRYIRNVRLVNSSGQVVMGPAEPFSNKVIFSDELEVPAGTEIDLKILADISPAALAGQTLIFEVASPFAVETGINSSTKVTSTEEFPLRTNRQEVTGSRLEISLASTSPAPRSVGIGQSGVVMAEFELYSPVEDATIKSLTLKKTGLMEDKHIENFRILDLTDNSIYKARSFRDQTILFDNLPKVKKGNVKTIRVLADISPNALPNTSFGIELTSEASVEAYSGGSERLQVSGRSVIGGRPVTVGEGQSQNSVMASFSNQAFEIPEGVADAALVDLRLKAEKGTAEVRKLVFTISGGVDGSISNYRLYDDRGRIVARTETASGRKITFSDHFPVSQSNNHFWLTADIAPLADGEKNIRYGIENAADIEAYDLKSGSRIESTGNFPLQSLGLTIIPYPERSPFLILNKFPANGDVVARNETVPVAKFIATAFYEDVRVERIVLFSNDDIPMVLTNVHILDETGRKYSATIAKGSLIIEDPIRVPANQARELTVMATILPGARGGTDFSLRIESDSQVIAKARGEEISVLAAYPLISGKSLVSTGQTECSLAVDSVCGRTYHACLVGPCDSIDSQYTNKCELERAGAYFLWDGSCSRSSPPATGSNQATGTPVTSSADFGDVSVAHPYIDAIMSLRENGLVQGFDDGSYRPEIEISRAAFTKIVVGAVASSSEIESCEFPVAGVTFSDVPADQWFASYVCVAATRGIINGFPDGSFRPEKSVSFAEAAKIVAVAFGAQKQNDAIWYRPYVEFMADKKAIPLTIDSLTENITRSEMAEMIWRLKEGVTNRGSRNAVEVML